MAPNETRHPERQSTDNSLRAEREKTDDELANRRAAIEEDADAVVHRARTRADDVLRAARDRADRDGAIAAPLADERRRQDDVVRAERETQDIALALEREGRKRALVELLKLEREETDLHLKTERARADDAVTTRETFMAMVSHDVRTLLGGIAMTAAMLLKDTPTDPVVRARAERIQRFTTRMNRLVGDLIDVAMVESGHPLIAPERRDLLRLLREADEAFQPVAAAHGILLTSEVVERPILARFDHERILQVIANIIGNAIRFTPEGGRITVKVDGTSDAVRFGITDTGAGIPSEHLGAIFERFRQVPGADRRGLGLGLYISKCIVEAHGGQIWAESDVGRGTTVFFTLPRAAATAAEPSAQG